MIVVLQLFVFFSFSQQTIPLYTGTIPNSKATAEKEFYRKGSDEQVFNVTKPSLTVYLPEDKKIKSPAIIICPGGGYGSLVINREGHDVARALTKKGIAAFVLKYRLPSDEWMQEKEVGPLQDAQQAIKIIREKASVYNIDESRVGVMGFSAGGHLAASTGVFSEAYIDNNNKTNLRPDFLVLVYPVITMDTVAGHKGSTYNLLGLNPSVQMIERFSVEKAVTEKTPPVFVTVAADDALSDNAMLLCAALKKKSVPFELHVFSQGGHGYIKYPAFADWTRLLFDWMRISKWIK